MKYLKCFENRYGRPRYYLDNNPDNEDGWPYYHDLKKMLCINNYIGELTDKYNFTVGKLYDIVEYTTSVMSFIDDSGNEQFFKPQEVYKNFSGEQSWEDYQSKQDAKKFGIF